MLIGVPRETAAGETRVAATPETAKKLKAQGHVVRVESGAGVAASATDEAYTAVGAEIVDRAAAFACELVLKVRSPDAAELALMKSGTNLVGMLNPFDRAGLDALAAAGLTSFALEAAPRTTRAQSMDVLSSQANIAGYRAVIDAAAEYGRVIPMMMTAAGMIKPATIFIMGVGVAGLQAIATARKLAAIVTATDVRPATKEQVVSLGAKFIAVEDEEFKQAETAAGYAKEMSADYKAKQAALTASHIAAQDIVITTALIPGRPAPVLITAAMVETMRPGSVIVDLAAERGGNCELTKPGETVVSKNGVKIIGPLNIAGRLPATASALYAKNLLAFIETLVDPKTKSLAIKWDDELVKATLLTKDGGLAHPSFQGGG